MPEATAAIVLTSPVATAVGGSIVAAFTAMAAAIAALWYAQQKDKDRAAKDKEKADNLYRELATANTVDAVGTERTNAILREIVKNQEAHKASTHARFDRIESRMEARR